MVTSDLCLSSDAYIVVKGGVDLLVNAPNKMDKGLKDIMFKNNSPSRSWILKISNADPEVVMPMYNLLIFSDNFSMTLKSDSHLPQKTALFASLKAL